MMRPDSRTPPSIQRLVLTALVLLGCTVTLAVAAPPASSQPPGTSPPRPGDQAGVQAAGTGSDRAADRAAQALESLGENPWYDPQTNRLRPVTVAPTDDDSIHRDSRWLPHPEKLAQPAAPSATTTTPLDLTAGNLLGWSLLVILLIAIVTLLVYAFSKIDREPDLPGSVRAAAAAAAADDTLAARIEQLPDAVRTQASDPLSEAERLMQRGQFDRAIIVLFGHQLLQLDRHQIIRLSRGKTNRQYVREAARHGAPAAILGHTVQTFEASYFGRHRISSERFGFLWQENIRLEQWLQSHREAAA